MMHRFGIMLVFLLLTCCIGHAQGFLGKSKTDIMVAAKDCEQEGNYPNMVAFKCGGRKSFFYFSANDTICDMYATDLDSAGVNETTQHLIASGFSKEKIKYIEPFLVSKHSDHQKFPSQIYSNGKVQYCIMPVSLNGKSTELHAVITRVIKKQE